MEREKRLNHVKNDCEIIITRLKRSKIRRKNKCWAQVSSGIILGLLIGFTMELKLFSSRGLQMNETCSSGLESGISSLSYKSERPKYNEDPLKIIRFEDPTVTLHNSQQSLVFVGVMTAQKYLSTRAVAVYETWGKELPGRIAFFSSEASTVPEKRKDLPLVRLRNVDDSYPPQKKSFMMLQYMWENYGDRFEWFIRADDDVYIRPDRLENFLRSVDSRKPLFIGQAGRGNQEEFGLLSLEYDENFCMGGPGIIMSRETLSRVAPHIKHCLKNLYTTHEDVELGRCVKKFADVSCTWSYEMQTILYHNSSGYDAFTGNLKQKEVNRAITLHPVKQHQYMYRIHNYMRDLKIQDLQHETALLHRDIKKAVQFINDTIKISEFKLSAKYPLFSHRIGNKNYLGDTEMIGLEPSLDKFKAKTVKEILHWDFIQRSLYSTSNLNPRRRIETPYREGLEDVVREVMEMINQYSRQRGRVIEYQDLLYGYFRLNPLHGANYILDMLLKYKKYRGRKMTVPVRRHAYLQQQFSGIDIREVFNNEEVKENAEEELKESALKILDDNPFKDVIETSISKIKEQFPILNLENNEPNINRKIINFILPLSGRYETFLRFIKNYEEVCLKTGEKTALVILLFRSQDNSSNRTMEYISNLEMKYPDESIKVIPVNDDFARAMALEIGTAYCKDDEYNILFFIDVDMIFTRQTLERIRLNTVRDKQVYFPIVYSEFDPSVVYNNKNITESPTHYLINADTGYWRQFGFGIASLYKKDFKKVGGFDTSIRGWGKEDVDLYDKFIQFASNLTIFRSVDPNLVHVFHIVDCDPNLEPTQLKMCKGTRKDTYGSVHQLAQFIYSNKKNFELATSKKNKAV